MAGLGRAPPHHHEGCSVTLDRYIHQEASRLIRRQEARQRSSHRETVHRRDRADHPPEKLSADRPEWWQLDSGFDPYLVRRRSENIGHAIWRSLRRGSYAPRPPVSLAVEKADGGAREVCIYQVADSAISRMVFDGILAKNVARMSGRAYAYRKDLSAQDAVQFVKSEWSGKSRMFVAEYDFRSFFSDLSHDHLNRMIEDRALWLSADEKQIMRAFMRSSPVPFGDYTSAAAQVAGKGVPQGTSISLVLANLAAADLDRQLERLGVGFVRYADDTLIWSENYSSLCDAVAVLGDEALRMGVTLNHAKSPGVSLLVPTTWQRDGEIRTKRSVEFLGYEIALDRCRIKAAGVQRIKNRCRALVFDNLLREPVAQNQHPRRIGANVDRDYILLLRQLRRLLYGDLAESQVRSFQRGDVPFRHFKGVMSAYPLVSDQDQLAELDGWLLHTVGAALRKRTRLLVAAQFTDLPTPHGLVNGDLIRPAPAASERTGRPIDLSLPSFRRIASLIARAADAHGLDSVANDPPLGPSNASTTGEDSPSERVVGF